MTPRQAHDGVEQSCRIVPFQTLTRVTIFDMVRQSLSRGPLRTVQSISGPCEGNGMPLADIFNHQLLPGMFAKVDLESPLEKLQQHLEAHL
jgi:hypothetical protein